MAVRMGMGVLGGEVIRVSFRMRVCKLVMANFSWLLLMSYDFGFGLFPLDINAQCTFPFHESIPTTNPHAFSLSVCWRERAIQSLYLS